MTVTAPLQNATIKAMTGLLFFLALVLFAALLLITAVVPLRSKLSPFELNRRSKDDKADPLDARRAANHTDVVSLQRVLQALLLVLVTALLVGLFGWIFGVILALFVGLEYGRIARLGFIRQFAQKHYESVEPRVFDLLERYPTVMRFLRWAGQPSSDVTVDSKEELIDLAKRSHDVLSHEEKQRIEAVLTFDARLVKDVMTPKSVIKFVKKGEVMGPLVLDDLHKTGHSRFPVIDGDLDHVIGMLYVRDVLTIDTTKKTTAKAESVMDKRVFFIHEDQTLGEALPAFLSAHHHLFVVINQYRETVGLLSLEDVLETLIGHAIIDEYDTHDDLRKVAERISKDNNHTTTSTDV